MPCCSTSRWSGPAHDLAPALPPPSTTAAGRDRLQLRPQARPGRPRARQCRHRSRPRARWRAQRASGSPAAAAAPRPDWQAGLTLDELSALSAPWFHGSRLCRSTTPRPSSPTTARSREAIGSRLTRLRRALPSLAVGDPAAEAPFCALTAATKPSPATLPRALKPKIVERRASAAACSPTKGGSFGFRGHRFELIEPGGPLRVARAGATLELALRRRRLRHSATASSCRWPRRAY